eukprot:gene210-4456_t
MTLTHLSRTKDVEVNPKQNTKDQTKIKNPVQKKTETETEEKKNLFVHEDTKFSFKRIKSSDIEIKGEKTTQDEVEIKALKLLRKSSEEDLIRQNLLRKRWINIQKSLKNRKPKIKRTSKNPIIIFNAHHLLNMRWGHLKLFSDDWTKDCPVSCKFTQDKEYYKDSQIVLGVENDVDDLVKNTSKKFAMLTLESVERYVGLSYEKLEKPDFIVSTSLFSDVIISYVYDVMGTYDHTIESMEELLSRPPIFDKKNDTILVSSFISNCKGRYGPETGVRYNYVKALSKYIDIHHYGQCFNNIKISQQGRGFKLKQQAKYYFTLSFENFVETDYATEKYFGTLMTDTIQIVLGSPKIHDLSPVNDKIVINANEYSPSELAKYLKKLVKDKKKMAQLRHWRSKGISKKFLRYTNTDFILKGKNSWICRLCESYHKRYD